MATRKPISEALKNPYKNMVILRAPRDAEALSWWNRVDMHDSPVGGAALVSLEMVLKGGKLGVKQDLAMKIFNWVSKLPDWNVRYLHAADGDNPSNAKDYNLDEVQNLFDDGGVMLKPMIPIELHPSVL